MRGRTDAGVSVLEYAGLVVLAAVLIGALVATGVPRTVASRTSVALCRILGGRNCGRGSPRPRAAPSPRPCDRPTPGPTAAAAPVSGRPLVPTSCGTNEANGPDPLLHAHAHNDYLNRHPLTDALDHGVNSVEADVHLNDCGDLTVAHDPLQAKHDPCHPGVSHAGKNGTTKDLRGTLRNQYVDPLLNRLAQNGGHVYPGSTQPFQLVVELKQDPDCDASCLQWEYDTIVQQTQVLNERYPGAVNVVVTGQVPKSVDRNSAPSWLKFDQQSNSCDLSQVPTNTGHYAMLSRDWDKCGKGKSDADLKKWVDEAHRKGYKVRFWNEPDDQAGWDKQRNAGVDLIGTGHLSRMDEYDHAHCYV